MAFYYQLQLNTLSQITPLKRTKKSIIYPLFAFVCPLFASYLPLPVYCLILLACWVLFVYCLSIVWMTNFWTCLHSTLFNPLSACMINSTKQAHWSRNSNQLISQVASPQQGSNLVWWLIKVVPELMSPEACFELVFERPASSACKGFGGGLHVVA